MNRLQAMSMAEIFQFSCLSVTSPSVHPEEVCLERVPQVLGQDSIAVRPPGWWRGGTLLGGGGGGGGGAG